MAHRKRELRLNELAKESKKNKRDETNEWNNIHRRTYVHHKMQLTHDSTIKHQLKMQPATHKMI